MDHGVLIQWIEINIPSPTDGHLTSYIKASPSKSLTKAKKKAIMFITDRVGTVAVGMDISLFLFHLGTFEDFEKSTMKSATY